ncbi:Hypothetical protein Tpal_1077 [Trichococcus palustris]|uniref:Uncharacterized protein n=1 Tax=Trichococcus palustris TaxID=140314 RepID=A0A143YJY1_9LACT|nr:hypothetical protein [Trichococcus palustris]CZQ88990.1 Hypothetical protein Tpal_1077 [Trichococcus palustris]SFL00332.1 hypothetical protein SAMN04488076_11318 [Trichococcus palustris]
MEIIQVAYEVPDDVVEGLATGALTRYGSLIRGHTGYKLHLKEVPIRQPENITAVKTTSASATASKSVFSVVKDTVRKHPVAAVVTVVVVGTATVGGIAYGKFKAKKKQTKEKIELPECEKDFNNAFIAYLDEVRAGNLKESTLDTLIEELNQLKERIHSNESEIVFSSEQLDTLINMVFDYTKQLAKANSYNVVKFRNPEIDSTEEAIDGLQECLSIQKQIFTTAS